MLIFLLIVIVVAIIIEKKSLDYPTLFVRTIMEPSKKCVEPGETFSLITTVENNTGKPLKYLQLEQHIPIQIKIKGYDMTRVREYEKQYNFVYQFSVKKDKQSIRKVNATIDRRGIYYIDTLKLRFGDFLGIKEITRDVTQNQSIIVYPKRLEDDRILKVLDDVTGEVIVNNFMLKDPMLVRGYREYTGVEPMKMISFTQSARMDELMVKEYEATKQETVNIIFDASYLGDFENYGVTKEATFCMVRTLIESFEDRHIAYRLIMNSFYEGAKNYGVNVMESDANSGHQLIKILEALGAASGVMCKSEELLLNVNSLLENEREFIYVAHRKNEENEDLLNRIRKEYGINLHTLYGEDFVEIYLGIED